MANINLKLLKPSDLKVIPAQGKPVYVFIKANAEKTAYSRDADGTFNNPNDGFANLVHKITMKNDGTN